MIDIENQVFTTVATALRTAFNGISVVGTLVLTPESYPAVSIEESDNFVYQNGIDSGDTENYAEVMYEVNVFSNKVPGSKAEAKSIVANIDSTMKGLGFIRRTRVTMPGETPTHCRMVCRYSAIVGKNELIYGR